MAKIDDDVKKAARTLYIFQRLSRASGRRQEDMRRFPPDTLLAASGGDVALHVNGELVARTLTECGGRICIVIGASFELSKTAERRLNAFLAAFGCGHKAVQYGGEWYWSVKGARVAPLFGSRRIALPSASLAQLYE